MSVTTDNGIRVSTMEERAKALLCDADRMVISKELINERVTAVFSQALHTGIGVDSLHYKVVNDPNYSTLNVRQKAFLLAEIDLRDCPVRAGDRIETLVDRADGIPYDKGAILGIRHYNEDTDIATLADEHGGWVISRKHFRLIPSLEFPADPGSPEVNYELVKNEAANRVATFVPHSGPDGDWGMCECQVVCAGVDYATNWFDGRGIGGRTWTTTRDGKRWTGEVVRWMRAKSVSVWLERWSMTAETVAETTHMEPIPERVIEPVPTPTIAELVAKVDELTRRVERLSVENVRLATWQQSAIEDAEKFSTTLGEIADRRELCSEFEEAIERANRVTSVLTFEGRRREMEVEFTGTITVPFTYSATITVENGASTEDAAAEWWSDNMSAADLVRGRNVEISDASFDDDPDISY